MPEVETPLPFINCVTPLILCLPAVSEDSSEDEMR